jgi:prolyl-tRNA editing enzyme YbaK/EbsC (Cys-tRNA(Pro) deacylase)
VTKSIQRSERHCTFDVFGLAAAFVIAKTLAFRMHDGRVFLLVARGDARVDNGKFKTVFGKGKMLGAHEVEALTGHPVGGVCPFGLATPLPVYLDRSLQDFDEVLPAAGSVNSALRISPALMAELTGGEWVDACQ